jgi:hypothetical protein
MAEREKIDRAWRRMAEVRPLTHGQRLRRLEKPALPRMATCAEVEAYRGEDKLKPGDYIEIDGR